MHVCIEYVSGKPSPVGLSVGRLAGSESVCIHYCNDVYLDQTVARTHTCKLTQSRGRGGAGRGRAARGNTGCKDLKQAVGLRALAFSLCRVYICLSDGVASISRRLTSLQPLSPLRATRRHRTRTWGVLIKREINRARFHLPRPASGLPRGRSRDLIASAPRAARFFRMKLYSKRGIVPRPHYDARATTAHAPHVFRANF